MDRVTDFESVGCAFESRRGHFLFSAFEPPWRGQVSSLRVRVAPGAFPFFCLRTPVEGTGQQLARSSRAGGISFFLPSNPRGGDRSAACAFESRRGHFLFSAFEPPWRGQVSSLRVRVAPGAFPFFCLRTPVEGTGQQLARSSRAGGISFFLPSNPRRGDCVSRLRVRVAPGA